MLTVRGARQHNLRGVDVDIPRGALSVFTGVSGSGKSSLAFDTIYAEGRRRYVESLSLHARQFLGRMEQPDVDFIGGLPPAIAIHQWGSGGENPRATVGTVTEVHDHLRLLYTHVGTAHCPRCGHAVAAMAVAQMVDAAMALPEGTRIQVLAPIAPGEAGDRAALLADLRRQGFVRVRLDGAVIELGDAPPLDPALPHVIDVVVDRLTVRPGAAERLAESLETACRQSGGIALLDVVEPGGQGRALAFTQRLVCAVCGTALEELVPRLFSFHSAYGACPRCGGLGATREVDPALVLPDPRRSLAEGALAPWGWGTHQLARRLRAVAAASGIAVTTPLTEAGPAFVQRLLYGSSEPIPAVRDGRPEPGVWEGMIPLLARTHREAGEDARLRAEIEAVMTDVPCPSCGGRRLRPEALAVTVAGLAIADLTARSAAEALSWVRDLSFTGRQAVVAAPILRRLTARLERMEQLGVGYLTLDRPAATLSGGESQRLRLATQIGSGLSGVLYVLDEPSIGLHRRDGERLIATLRALRDEGNTVLVVEHDEDTIRAADHIVDVGPGSGEEGGRVVVAGTLDQVLACPESVTGAFLSGRRGIPVPTRRRPAAGVLSVRGARLRNLRDIDVDVPLGCFVAVTGVSGAGKSTLVRDVLLAHLQAAGSGARRAPPGRLEGAGAVSRVLAVDGSPIGRTPRANPATYTGVLDDLRALYAQTPEARARGYDKSRFSFNLPGGRCEACAGEGTVRVEMVFLPDVHVPCEVCGGRRYNRETLEVRYGGRSIAEALDLTGTAALALFARVPPLRRKLQALVDAGLGYLRLGQSATTLSGGEAQRLKLAAELARRGAGHTLLALDEPTTGLHPADVQRLLRILHRLVDGGDSVLVIEHDMDVVKTADWVIDLGPEGGEGGGRLVAAGTPEEVARSPASHTARYLRAALAGPWGGGEREPDAAARGTPERGELGGPPGSGPRGSR